jgi:hypothetical protein
MQRTGRNKNILSKLSNGRSSAGLNLTELQRGHWCRIQSKCGNQLGQLKRSVDISVAPPLLLAASAKQQ